MIDTTRPDRSHAHMADDGGGHAAPDDGLVGGRCRCGSSRSDLNEISSSTATSHRGLG